MFSNILIVGCGLIGSSILRGSLSKKISKNIYVFEKSKKNISLIKKINKKIKFLNKIDHRVSNMDLIVLSTHMSQYNNLIKKLLRYISSKNLITDTFNCHHIIVENWDELESEKGVIFVSIPTLLDSSLAPEGKHIVHAFTPSSISEWEGLSRKEYFQKKEKYFSFLVEKISTVLPNLEQNIDHKEIGTPKTHKKFLGRYEGSYGPIPSKKLLGLLPMPFNTTKIENLYCVGDSCFPGQGLNAVAFSGYACAHKIGAKLNINSFKLPD